MYDFLPDIKRIYLSHIACQKIFYNNTPGFQINCWEKKIRLMKTSLRKLLFKFFNYWEERAKNRYKIYKTLTPSTWRKKTVRIWRFFLVRIFSYLGWLRKSSLIQSENGKMRTRQTSIWGTSQEVFLVSKLCGKKLSAVIWRSLLVNFSSALYFLKNSQAGVPERAAHKISDENICSWLYF